MKTRDEKTLQEALKEVRELYRSEHRFYVSVPYGPPYENYWGPKADPDGAVRDPSTAAEFNRWVTSNFWELRQLESRAVRLANSWIDVGAGIGRVARFLKGSAWKLDRLVCVEPDEAGRRLIEIEHPEAMVCEAVDHVPLWIRADVVSALHVLEHMVDPIEEVEALRQRMRTGGIAVFTTPDFASPYAQAFGTRFRLLHDPTHISLFSTDSLLRMLRTCGFEILDVHYPFFGTDLATEENLKAAAIRWNSGQGVSPAGPGNMVSVLARAL